MVKTLTDSKRIQENALNLPIQSYHCLTDMQFLSINISPKKFRNIALKQCPDNLFFQLDKPLKNEDNICQETNPCITS